MIKQEMTQLEIIEALQTGKIISKKRILGGGVYNYRLQDKILQYCDFRYSNEWHSTNFVFFFDKFINYTYSIYQQKPKLEWIKHCEHPCCTEFIATADGDFQYFIINYANGYGLIYRNTVTPSSTDDHYLGLFSELIYAKYRAQQHFGKGAIE